MGDVVADSFFRVRANGTLDSSVIYSPLPPDDLADGETYTREPAGWDADPAVSLFKWAGDETPGATGWIMRETSPPLISAMMFKLLFTQAERIAIAAAAATDPIVADYRDLVNSVSAGIDLTHPVVVDGVNHLTDAELLGAGRAEQILAGHPPA